MSTKLVFEMAQRVKELPPYLFAEIDRLKKEVQARGVDVINLGIGDPDLPTPKHIIDALKVAADDPKNHQYPDYEGLPVFRKAVAAWYKSRFKVDLDQATEVVSLIGSKEGIANIHYAFVNPGDVVLCPNPGYPVYRTGTLFAGGERYNMPLKRENNFLPDLDAIPDDIAKRAKILWLCSPNNPTASLMDEAYFKKAIAFARKHNVIVAHDAAYSEIYYEKTPLSFLQVEGAKEVGVEFHSLSKTYNMTGWRIGMVVGNADVVAGIGKIKTNVDSGVFQAVQMAAVAALTGDQQCVEDNRKVYRGRRDALIKGLREAGLDPIIPEAAFYCWIPVPAKYDSKTFCAHLLQNAGIVVTPGVGFGEHGEGYFRVALTQSEDRIREACERIKKLGF